MKSEKPFVGHPITLHRKSLGDKSKRGHSFEVDVWSMGVILFTVLIGKPPYEAKDVKATYQRILNNEYSFPRHIDISLSAKSLIKSMLQSVPSDRPTLDEIGAHPFLADDSHLPLSLPSSVLSIAPIWRVNEYGDLVCTTEKGANMKKPALPRSNSSISSRRPFSSHDPNRAASTSAALPRRNGDINMERVVKTTVAAMTASADRRRATAHSPADVESLDRRTTLVVTAQPLAFEIFDESKSPCFAQRDETVTKRDASGSASGTRLTEEALCQQTKALSLQSAPRRPYAVASSVITAAPSATSVFSGASTENDADVFKFLVDHLSTVLSVIESRKGSYRSSNMPLLRSSKERNDGPTKWVTRYVDYTCKYGLGFLLNDGCSGVYFNDSTKTVLEAAGQTFQYMERKRSSHDETARRGETTVETHTLDNFPESLKKKVTLLKHFRNYLLQQQVFDGLEESVNTAAASKARDASPDLVYVKKWVRTKHAILFSLSNRTIQVIFYDQTELLLTPLDVTFLTYVDKHRQWFTHPFTDELVGTSPEIEKRLRYAKDILLQLLSSGSATTKS
jgi:POLO box duplicated region/Protein kinase domain